MPVSRETDVPPPEVLARYFPDDKPIHRYVDLLTTDGVVRGVMGPREVQRVWGRHVLNCAAAEAALPRGIMLADIGSGAGLPGIVLALARPDLRITLVEPLLRRVRFLEEVLDALGLGQVEVVRTRAEDLAGERSFDAVTARAVAPLDRLIPWTLPLCRRGGELVALKGSSAARELAEAAPVIEQYGGTAARVETLGVGLVAPPTTVVRIQSTGQVWPSAQPRARTTARTTGQPDRRSGKGRR